MPSTVQNDWVERVLGLAPSGGSNPLPSSPAPNGALHGANRVQALRSALAKLVVPIYADTAALATLQAQRETARAALAPAQPTAEQQTAAEQAIAAFVAKDNEERARVAGRRSALLLELGRLDDPEGAEPDEVKAMKDERTAATAALAAAAPVPADLEKADKAIAALRALVGRAADLAALAKTRPQAAAAARTTLKGFAGELGNVAVTDDMIAEAQRTTATAQAALDACDRGLQDAQNLPAATAQQQAARKAAIQRAQRAYEAARGKRDVASKRENAAFGQKSLDGALRHGPLSAETARPFGDDVAAKLIAGYGGDSRLADGAVQAATTARYPGAIADALGSVADRAKDGFKSADGRTFPKPEKSRDYAAKLLTMAGNVGPDYVAGMGAYIDSGRQFEPDPMGDAGKRTWAAVAQNRSAVVASALVKRPGGTIDTTSPAAKAAIGDALYNPDTLRNPTPALNAQILETTRFMSDPVTGPQANTVLRGMGTPQPGAASTLVRGSLGKRPTAAVDANDARQAVVASMLKPLDQGSVGSCFSTGPARRARQNDPLAAMRSFGEIATKGTYTPPNGPSVAAVTTVPPGEDPVMRSWEYSLATSAARSSGAREEGQFLANMDRGLDQLKDAAVSDTFFLFKSWDWNKKKQALRQSIADAFTFVYDSTATMTNASDGSSSQGRYVIQRKSNRAEIRTKADFIAQMGAVAVAAFQMDPASKEAGEVRAEVAKDNFINAVCPSGYKPWELAGGGFGDTAAKTLTGPTTAAHDMLGQKTAADSTSEGTRTTAVLASVVNALGASPDQMVTIQTAGMHTFNALPNDPSLAPIKGANPTETGRKIQANLLDKGTALANTDLSADRAGWLFDQEIAKAAKAETNPALKARIDAGARTNRPRAAMKPAALQSAIDAALADYQDAKSDAETASWTQAETLAGRPPAGPAVTGHKQKLKADKVTAVETGAKNTMMRDLGAPEFVIADSNWGSALDHTYFVVAPDPTTGAPRLWQKTEPPGTLVPMEAKWIDATWQRIQ